MVNINKLRGKIVECGKTVEEVAELVGIDKSTLYRRLCVGDGAFTINEADKIASVLQLSAKELNEIFLLNMSHNMLIGVREKQSFYISANAGKNR